MVRSRSRGAPTGTLRLSKVVPRSVVSESCRWLAARPAEWSDRIEWAALDPSNSYRSVFDTMVLLSVQVADLFHVVQLANALGPVRSD